MKESKKISTIAFYLPQFHPTKNNNIWWGTGFTEWTNVCKARPLFKGHYQPHVPADLGFYDLRLPESRIAQAEMAKEYGIDGFCYYHYWFDDDKQELERPFNEVLQSGNPDFPFMLCWANESWHSKFWKYDGTVDKRLLIQQVYGDAHSHEKHFMCLLSAFKDPRYLKIEGKSMFMIYRPLDFPKITEFIELWQRLAKENGLKGIYFIGQTIDVSNESSSILSLGFDAVNSVRHYDILRKRSLLQKVFTKTFRSLFPRPLVADYGKNYSKLVGEEEKESNIIPTLMPNWDHTPRSGKAGYVLTNSAPRFFSLHVEDVFKAIENKCAQEKIVFIKSWNEWGEGNHMEPDLLYGKGYLEEFKKVRDKFGY